MAENHQPRVAGLSANSAGTGTWGWLPGGGTWSPGDLSFPEPEETLTHQLHYKGETLE